MIIALHKDVDRGLEEFCRRDDVQVIQPESLSEYLSILKSYKPTKQNVVLTRSHNDWALSLSTAQWRATEIYFDKVGGTTWGKKPQRESLTYYTETSIGQSKILATAQYSDGRAKFIKTLGASYFGRSSADPQALIVGVSVNPTNLSKQAQFLLESIPTGWWQMVGYLPATKGAVKPLQWFDWSNVVTLGDQAHNLLEENNMIHVSLDSLNKYYSVKKAEDKDFGLWLKTYTEKTVSEDFRGRQFELIKTVVG